MKVFDSTWSGATRLPGVQRLPVVYEAQVLTNNAPDLQKIQYWSKTYTGLVCYDIECWPTSYRTYNEVIIADSVNKLNTVLTGVHSTSSLGGFFATPGNAHYAIENPTLIPYYKSVVSYLSPVLRNSDAIFLEGYYWWDNINQWKAALDLAISEVSVYKKPIYVFMWDKGILGKEVTLPANIIKEQLDFCLKSVDGVCWWSKSGQQFDYNSDWWNILKGYL